MKEQYLEDVYLIQYVLVLVFILFQPLFNQIKGFLLFNIQQVLLKSASYLLIMSLMST